MLPPFADFNRIEIENHFDKQTVIWLLHYILQSLILFTILTNINKDLTLPINLNLNFPSKSLAYSVRAANVEPSIHLSIAQCTHYQTLNIKHFITGFPVPLDIKCQTTSSPGSCQSTANTLTTSTRITALCAACCRPICDRYIMRVADEYYHENRCLKCTSCSIPLTHSCFTRNGKLYCRIDYER